LGIRELHSHRSPPARNLRSERTIWWRDLPDHPSVRTAEWRDDGDDHADADDPALLTVSRPEVKPAPSPPEDLLVWLESGWREPDNRAAVRDSIARTSDGETIEERFDEDPERRRLFEEWNSVREVWARDEVPARRTKELFEQLYGIYAELQREAEKLELVLGNGVLRWMRDDGEVHYPLIVQRVELQLDPSVPELSITDVDSPPELYGSLLSTFEDVDAQVVRALKEEFEANPTHPISAPVSGFLTGVAGRLGPRGRYVKEAPPPPAGPDPVVRHDPLFVVRARAQGLSVMIDRIIEHSESETEFPPSLVRIVGLESRALATGGGPPEGGSGWSDVDATDVLLSKEANKEQITIARKVDEESAVLVQGPPGTGKSHTIANLIGHFLAQGKSVLVTSHTTKALRVLRDHVHADIRDLCVSVLESDAEGQQQLKSAVEAISGGLARRHPGELREKAEQLDAQRQGLIQKLTSVRHELLMIRRAEYEPISIAGRTFEPSQAARQVAENTTDHRWLPGPLVPGAPLPLSSLELRELYRSNEMLTPDDEPALVARRPSSTELPLPDVFAVLLERLEHAAAVVPAMDLWSSPPSTERAEDVEQAALAAQMAVALIAEGADWTYAVIEDGQTEQGYQVRWTDLVDEIDACSAKAAELAPKMMRHAVEVPESMRGRDVRATIEEIRSKTADGRPGLVQRWLHPRWKPVLEGVRVDGQVPSSAEEWVLVGAFLDLEQARSGLRARWNRQMRPLGGPDGESLGAEPERTARQFAAQIRELLGWHTAHWEPVHAQLVAIGLRWDTLLGRQPQVMGNYGTLRRLVSAVRGPLLEELASRATGIWGLRAQAALSEIEEHLARFEGRVVGELLTAIRSLDIDAYSSARTELDRLEALEVVAERRAALLEKLSMGAPGWADAIARRISPHESAEIPGTLPDAWTWRQMEEELKRRAERDVDELERSREALERDLRSVTAEMISCFAWFGLIDRTSDRARQALVGWADTMRRIGRGTGRRAPRLRAEAKKQMEAARVAVPVWVMPMARLVDAFDPRSSRFDVVIIDEASQSDVVALVALYLGKQVLVVGDHEQVSPSAVGQRLDVVQGLIDSHLAGIPNSHLYDGQTSIYDLGRQSFPGSVRLIEHFRCVPDLIGFSNDLSYDGEIRPLRDPASGLVRPALEVVHVPEATSLNKTNDKEAAMTAALVVAASEQPEYGDATMGVVGLVGEEQARAIGEMLLRHLRPEVYDRHRLVCGNPAQFQGDERDVMFLSMVDGPADGPLPLRQQSAFKQRFNVAASRARDQMWLVHSLNSGTDLKPGDLRRRLIEYVHDPGAFSRAVDHAARRGESEFEKAVIRDLMAEGFRVTSQVEVGYYRIDMVVDDGKNRVAIECDGDRYHPLEKLPDDMARQAILERLGWKFIRIRGTQYFRDREGTIGLVVSELERRGIERRPLVDAHDPGESTELRDRVVRRAHELVREWGETSPKTVP
jgi:very-short-patch-repair endonuclease